MSGAPLLRTERLDLWLPVAADLAGMIALVSPEETRRFLGPARPDPADQFARLLRNAGSWSLYGYGTFVVRLRGDDTIIGNCGVFHSWRGLGQGMDDVPEAGWIVDREECGRGIAGEAMRAALDWFDTAHGRHRVTCMIEAGNAVSHRLATRLGFRAYVRSVPQDDRASPTFYERV